MEKLRSCFAEFKLLTRKLLFLHRLWTDVLFAAEELPVCLTKRQGLPMQIALPEAESIGHTGEEFKNLSAKITSELARAVEKAVCLKGDLGQV